MRATGIVRRIDDLGRVVIPKEIRRTMSLKAGDPVELYTNSDGSITFKKYVLVDEEIANELKTALEIILDQPFGLYDDNGGLVCGLGVFESTEQLAEVVEESYTISCYDGYAVATHEEIPENVRRVVRRLVEHHLTVV